MMGYARLLCWSLTGVWMVLTLVACGASDGPGAAAPSATTNASAAPPVATLDGTTWVLTKLNGSDLIAGTKITLSFTGSRANGSGGCNSYGGTYTASADTIQFMEIASTLMACTAPPGVNEQETAYYAALNKAATYRIENGRLAINDAAGQITLVFMRQ